LQEWSQASTSEEPPKKTKTPNLEKNLKRTQKTKFEKKTEKKIKPKRQETIVDKESRILAYLSNYLWRKKSKQCFWSKRAAGCFEKENRWKHLHFVCP